MNDNPTYITTGDAANKSVNINEKDFREEFVHAVEETKHLIDEYVKSKKQSFLTSSEGFSR